MNSVMGQLDQQYDRYLAFKNNLRDRHGLDFSLAISIYPEFGTPNGGKPVDLLAYYPSVTWKPFTNTVFGSGEFNVTFGHQQDLGLRPTQARNRPTWA